MKETLTTNEIASKLFEDKDAGWSYDGAHALAEHLEQLEADSGDEMEFDRVAIRCEFTEYPSAVAAWQDYDPACQSSGDEDEDEAEALRLLQDRTTVIEFAGGIIVATF